MKIKKNRGGTIPAIAAAGDGGVQQDPSHSMRNKRRGAVASLKDLYEKRGIRTAR